MGSSRVTPLSDLPLAFHFQGIEKKWQLTYVLALRTYAFREPGGLPMGRTERLGYPLKQPVVAGSPAFSQSYLSPQGNTN